MVMSDKELYLRASNISLRFPKDIGVKASSSKIWRKLIGIDYPIPDLDYGPILKNVSLELKAGDRLGLTGHNGAGKTTLLKVLSGGLPAQKGTIETNGRIVSLLNRTQGMSLEASGYENILLRGLYLGFSLKEMRKKAEHIIEFSELADHIHKPVRTYSAGMRARLAFSIIVESDPEILLLDEWIGAGDRQFQEKASKRMIEFVNKASILILASHSERLINMTCNKIARMKNGRIEEVLLTQSL